MPYPTSTAGRILVVDDQLANLRVVGALLSRHGFEVTTASTGDEALQLILQRAPDLLLLDMMMPGMDGFALLAEIKRHADLQSMPVVFLTAAQDRDLLLRAFDAGAVDYVTKPFMPEELLARVNAHIGLKLTRDRLERIAHERQALVNLVAHDLKNPLSSVLFASDMLLQSACKPERIPRYLQMIHESAGDAVSYIRRYLESQGESHKKSADCGDVAGPACNLRETLEWLVQRYEMQLEARGMRLSAKMPDADACVAIEGLVLRQVTENLMTNAIKYAVDGGEVDLAVNGGAPGYWQLRVSDRGAGISANKQRQLFTPFTRLSDQVDDNSSGLGLSLAKKIVEQAGGHLWYEDRTGGGACFVIELPEAASAS
jgi:two-component system, sensor histidine kinase and response regulator